MVGAGCIFVAGIHPSRISMSGSFESVRWNACVHRLDLGLLSSERVLGKGVRTRANSKGKIPSTGGSDEARTRDAASRRTGSQTFYRLIFSVPPNDSTKLTFHVRIVVGYHLSLQRGRRTASIVSTRPPLLSRFRLTAKGAV